MEVIQEIIDSIIQKLNNFVETGKGDYFGWIMATITAAIFLFLRKRIKKVFTRLKKDTKKYESKILQTLRLKHEWIPKTFSMDDLYIPVKIANSNSRTSLEKKIKELLHLRSLNNNTIIPRLLLLGDAGSGKSIACRAVTKMIFENSSENILPITMSFEDIKEYFKDNRFEREEFILFLVKYLSINNFFDNKNDENIEFDYVESSIKNGSFFLIIDGFDEISSGDRHRIAVSFNKLLNNDFNIPYLITSRLSVYESERHIFQYFGITSELFISQFTRNEIVEFINKWPFKNTKSHEQLINILNKKLYLQNIATNPLLLTIIIVLYLRDDKFLLDNRIEFYAESLEYFLTKHGKHGSKGNEKEKGNNILSSTSKKKALQEISYVMLKTELAEIRYDKAISIISKINLPECLAPEIVLDEIIHNSGLLIPLNKSANPALMFSHRTFLEFMFARKLASNDFNEMIKLYESNKTKWKETFVFFCSLINDKRYFKTTYNFLLQNFISSQKAQNIDSIIFQVLIENENVRNCVDDYFIETTKNYLTDNLNSDIISNLGYLASLSKFKYSISIKNILINLLNNPSADDASIQEIIFALLNLNLKKPDIEIEKLILSKIHIINIAELIIRLNNNYDTKYYANEILRIIEKRPNKVSELLTGLREINKLEFMLELFLRYKHDEIIKMIIAFNLYKMSGGKNFLTLVDNFEIDSNLQKIYAKYKWNWNSLQTENGKILAFEICYYTAKYLKKHPHSFKNIKTHNHFTFLVNMLLMKKNVYNSFLFNEINTSYIGLKKHWINKLFLSENHFRILLLIVFTLLAVIYMFVDWKEILTPIIITSIFVIFKFIANKETQLLKFSMFIQIFLSLVYFGVVSDYFYKVLFPVLILGELWGNWSLYNVNSINSFFFYNSTINSYLKKENKDEKH